MSIRVGINGFGRIGRSVFRLLDGDPRFSVVGINDPFFAHAALAYFLQYDTVMGVFGKPVRADRDLLHVGDRRIPLHAEREPAKIPWGAQGCDVVVESTGKFVQRETLEKHLQPGVGRVLLTVPAKDPIDAMVVLGVNEHTLKKEHRLVSCASCTTNALAPLAKVVDEAFGIESGIMTTVHAVTNDQRLTDSPHKDPRRSRAAGENIIPTTTGAARAVGKILPQLAGKLDGMALRVPVIVGSIVDLMVRLRRPASAEALNLAVEQAAAGPLKGILAYSEAPLVSSDIVGNPHSSIFDAGLTQAKGDGYARLVTWYDNEWGYSNRCVELIAKLAAL